MAKLLEPKYLEGLKFHFSVKKEVEKDGRKTTKHFPQERPLTEEDLLSWKDYGDRIVIATKNGKKIAVKKSPGK